MTKKIIVCGDSWFSSDRTCPGKSFGEVLAERKGWELVSLARGGCSNFAIALQIDKAVELKADIIIVGATTADRIELPIKPKTDSLWEKIKSSWSWESWFNNQPYIYDPAKGPSNILYPYNDDLSYTHSFLKDPTIISESINNLLFWKLWQNKFLDQEQLSALKSYVLNLYDHEIKKQYDSWIISNACRKLIDTKIPFLLSYNLIPKEISWLPIKNKLDNVENDMFNIHMHDPLVNYRFHYNAEYGIKIADYIEKRLTQFDI